MSHHPCEYVYDYLRLEVNFQKYTCFGVYDFLIFDSRKGAYIWYRFGIQLLSYIADHCLDVFFLTRIVGLVMREFEGQIRPLVIISST
jgi:hypothetical protein